MAFSESCSLCGEYGRACVCCAPIEVQQERQRRKAAEAEARDEALREEGRQEMRATACEGTALSQRDFASLLELIENPQPPSPALVAALERAKAVQRPEAPEVTAAREEGRRQEREAVVSALRTQAALHRGRARGFESRHQPPHVVGRANAIADTYDAAASDIAAGMHLEKTKEGG